MVDGGGAGGRAWPNIEKGRVGPKAQKCDEGDNKSEGRSGQHETMRRATKREIRATQNDAAHVKSEHKRHAE